MAKFGWLIIIAFLIGGCAGRPNTTQSPESLRILQCTEGWSCISGPEDTPLPSSTDSGRAQTDPSSQPTISPAAAAQQIIISNVQGNVAIQETPNGNYVPAQSGMMIPLGILIQTDNSSRTSLTVRPGGTAINVGHNSSLVIKMFSTSADGKLETRVTLDTGKIWILPRGGQVVIKTEIGTTSSDGSPFGVS